MAPFPVARGPLPSGARCAERPPYRCRLRAGPIEVVTEGSIARAHAAGVQVHVWTVNDRAEMHRLLDLGVDGLITDRADVLREVLKVRGQWRA